jgi:hypothetical protein
VLVRVCARVCACSVCGKATVQKEQFNHLILDLPQDDDAAGSNAAAAAAGGSSSGSGLLAAAGSSSGLLNRAPVADLSSLLANHFNPETCDKACEGCGAAAVQHKVEHAIRRLPRVLVVQLKRFKWVISPSGIPDCRCVVGTACVSCARLWWLSCASVTCKRLCCLDA